MWGDGKQTRSFTYIDDCVEGILRITKSDFKEPLNLGSCEMVGGLHSPRHELTVCKHTHCNYTQELMTYSLLAPNLNELRARFRPLHLSACNLGERSPLQPHTVAMATSER